MNSRKTGTVSSAPPKGHRSSFPDWWRASAPFALLMRAKVFLLVPSLIGLFGCGREISKGVSVNSVFRPYVTADTKAMIDIDLSRLRAAPFWQAHEQQFNLDRLESPVSQVGVDLKHDVSELLLLWDGKQALLMVRGQFDRATIQHKLDGLGVRSSQFKNHRIFGDARNSITFVDQKLALAGPIESVHAALNSNGGRQRIPDELARDLENVPGGRQIWVASRGELPFADVPMRSDYESLLSNLAGYVTDTSIGLLVDTGLTLNGQINCISDQGARRVKDALRGGIGFARLSTPDNKPELLRAYDAIHVDQNQQKISIGAELSKSLADQLTALLPRLNESKRR